MARDQLSTSLGSISSEETQRREKGGQGPGWVVDSRQRGVDGDDFLRRWSSCSVQTLQTEGNKLTAPKGQQPDDAGGEGYHI